jgi:alpha-beta hydrolase superfamily lysophospholipase
VPLLFFHGARHVAWCWDLFLGFFADASYRAVALKFFPDMGHNMMIEPGWAHVAARIHAWLETRDLVIVSTVRVVFR